MGDDVFNAIVACLAVVWSAVVIAGFCMMFAKFDRDEELNEGRMPPMIWSAIKSYFACAWSAWTYIPPWGKTPSDKPSYWANCLGFGDKSAELVAAWDAYRVFHDFHHLKDILVEWVDAWPQRAAKVMALGGCLFALASFIAGFSIGAWWL